jgi:radical SAM superfamily enzyme YgiQ (UPF0313 family)
MRPDRRIALVSFDVPVAGSLSTFSYSVHKLRASLVSCPELADAEVEIISFQSGDPERFLEALEAFEPTLIGATLYVWSLVPFREVARRYKAMAPEVPIVVGGPSARKNVFDLEPYRPFTETVDAMVTGEGESIIRELAIHHLEPDWREKVRGLLLPANGEWVSNGEVERPKVDDYPSPYMLGEAPEGLTGFIETFRGCPISCSFCQWGGVPLGGIHSKEYLVEHLEGLAKTDVANVMMLDAAFNLNPKGFRNLMAAEKEVGAMKDRVVFGHVYPTFVKDEHIEFFQMLGQVHPAVGVQSFVPEVLERIGRPFDLQRFERVLDALRGHVAIDIELILGLPGDDPASFRKTLHRAVEVGDSVRIAFCMILPDALLDRARPEDGLEFDPETFYLRSCKGWTPESLAREWRYVHDIAGQHYAQEIEGSWVGFHVYEQSRVTEPWARGVRGSAEDEEEPKAPASRDLPARTVERLRSIVAEGNELYRLEAMRRTRSGVEADLVGPRGPVTIEGWLAELGDRYFALVDDVAYVHQGPVNREETEAFRAVIQLLHRDLRAALADPLQEPEPEPEKEEPELDDWLVRLRPKPAPPPPAPDTGS